MDELEQKAEEYANMQAITSQPRYQIKCAYKDGYKQGRKDLANYLVETLKELESYSTSPSCTKGMELFIDRIEKSVH